MPSCSLIRGFCIGAVALLLVADAENATKPTFAVRGESTSDGGRLLRSISSNCEDELTCQIVIESTRYDTGDEADATACIRVVDGIPTFASYYVTIPKEVVEPYKSSIEDGKLLLSICGARLVADAVILDDDAQFSVIDANYSPDGTNERAGWQRHLLEYKNATDASGERHLIAFRINGARDDPKVLNSTAEIHRALFDDGISVKSQYKKCSIEKLSFVSKGVYDVFLPRALGTFASALEVRNFIFYDIHQYSPMYKADYGTTDVRDVAHNIMFCMPPFWSFIANAQSGGAISTYSNQWCADLTTVMHEIAHNFGRGHAGRNGNPLGDYSSVMSSSTNKAWSTGPQKCFNSAQNVEFGWYKEHILRFNPSVDAGRMIKLASFVDVRKAGALTVEPAIIKIGKYNLQYNQAKDYNNGAGSPNSVIIVADMDAGVNWVQAELSAASPQYTFSESGKTIYVNYCAAVTGSSNTPDAVYMGIGIGRSACTTVPTAPSPTPPKPAPVPPKPLCENIPKRVVRYGNKQKSRCANVTADICIRDALTKEFEPMGKKIYELCQQQCASKANCMTV